METDGFLTKKCEVANPESEDQIEPRPSFGNGKET